MSSDSDRRRPTKVLELTSAARERLIGLMTRSERPVAGLRIGLREGGCAGMSYVLEYAQGPEEGDEIVEDGGAAVFIDRSALLFLLGSTMDFLETKMESGFVFNNPNQLSACGCGESVALRAAPAGLLAEFERGDGS